MAKNSSKSKSSRGVANTTARPTGRSTNGHVTSPTLSPVPRISPPLSLLEDRRRYHPDGRNRDAKTVYGTVATPTVIKKTPPRFANIAAKRSARAKARIAAGTRYPSTDRKQTKALVTFQEPNIVIACIRRKMRRRVMFAFKRQGGGKARPRRNWLSNYSCR